MFNNEQKKSQLVRGIKGDLKKWQRVGSPRALDVANSVSGWMRDLKQLNVAATKSYEMHNAILHLESAWENRDNPREAMKFIRDALTQLEMVDAEHHEYEPQYRRSSTEAMYGDSAYQMRARAKAHEENMSKGGDAQIEERVRAFVKSIQDEVLNVIYIPQDQAGYLSQNPHLESRLYAQAAARVKTWMASPNSNFHEIARYITPESEARIKNIANNLDAVIRYGGIGQLSQAQRRQVQSSLRGAMKALEGIQTSARHMESHPEIADALSSIHHNLRSLYTPLEYVGITGMKSDNADLAGDLHQHAMFIKSHSDAVVNALPGNLVASQQNMGNVSRLLNAFVTSKDKTYRVKCLDMALANVEATIAEFNEYQRRVSRVYDTPFS